MTGATKIPRGESPRGIGGGGLLAAAGTKRNRIPNLRLGPRDCLAVAVRPCKMEHRMCRRFKVARGAGARDQRIERILYLGLCLLDRHFVSPFVCRNTVAQTLPVSHNKTGQSITKSWVIPRGENPRGIGGGFPLEAAAPSLAVRCSVTGIGHPHFRPARSAIPASDGIAGGLAGGDRCRDRHDVTAGAVGSGPSDDSQSLHFVSPFVCRDNVAWSIPVPHNKTAQNVTKSWAIFG